MWLIIIIIGIVAFPLTEILKAAIQKANKKQEEEHIEEWMEELFVWMK